MPPTHRLRPRARRRYAYGALLIALLAALTAVPAKGETSAGTVQQDLPGSFRWSSTGPVISPQQDGSNSVAVKDPSVVQGKDGRWHVFMTTAARTSGDWSLAHAGFSDWSQAAGAKQTHLETASQIGTGYRAAPHAFYFAPKDEWYLVYQTGLPSFSTTKDINDPTSWSAPKNLMDSMPDIVRENIGNGNWLDFYVICDDAKCYLFSADDNGHVYRAETTVADFPNGFGNTQIVLQDSRNALFEGGAVYRVQGTDTYLLIWEAIGGDGNRYYRSFTSQGLEGDWQPLAATEANPFARSTNVTFSDGAWTKDISHGELLRATDDQTMTIDPCRLQLLYQGRDPASGGEYSQLPYRLGLATQTGSTC